MMRLSTLWKVDATIDALGSSPVAERILGSWPHEAGSVRFFRSSANFLYVFQNNDIGCLRFRGNCGGEWLRTNGRPKIDQAQARAGGNWPLQLLAETKRLDKDAMQCAIAGGYSRRAQTPGLARGRGDGAAGLFD